MIKTNSAASKQKSNNNITRLHRRNFYSAIIYLLSSIQIVLLYNISTNSNICLFVFTFNNRFRGLFSFVTEISKLVFNNAFENPIQRITMVNQMAVKHNYAL